MRKDLVGMKFGRLTVVSFSRLTNCRRSMWICQCECGKEVEVEGSSLKNGNTKSCGCLKLERNRLGRRTHGKSRTALYRVWASMIGRCERKTDAKYPTYGARGIRVCDKWHDFQKFFDDVSGLPNFGKPGFSLDRIDNNGDYEPGNVRWATPKEQGRNKRNNRWIEIAGEWMTLSQAVEKYQIHEVTILSRIKAGCTDLDLVRRAYATPERNNKKCKYFVEYNGQTIPLSVAAQIAHVSYSAMLERFKRGYTGDALFRKSWYEKKYGEKK